MFKAIVLNKILYALPVYYGYLTEGQKGVLVLGIVMLYFCLMLFLAVGE